VTATLVDQVEDTIVDVTRPIGLCTPVDVSGEGIEDPLLHLKRYRIKRAKAAAQSPRVRRTIHGEDRYGQHVLQTLREESLLVPTLVSLDGPADLPAADRDHYECYRVRQLKRRCTGDLATHCRADGDCAAAGGTCYLGFPRGVQADLVDQFAPGIFEVKKPKLVCLPVGKDGEGIRNPVDSFTGYQIKVAGGEPRHVRVSGIHLSNRSYGREVVTTRGEDILLVPSREIAPASPGGAFLDGDPPCLRIASRAPGSREEGGRP
jgi:hypothetical protein